MFFASDKVGRSLGSPLNGSSISSAIISIPANIYKIKQVIGITKKDNWIQ